MTNERLRSQLAVVGITVSDLAARVGVDPKTVERWITRSRVPHRRHREATAQVLGSDEVYLWPSLIEDPQTRSASLAEFVTLYPHRGLVPADLWNRLIDEAQSRIDVLVYAGLFLVDNHPDLAAALRSKGERGMRGRFLFGDPDSAEVRARGEEEGIGEGLAARVRLSLRVMSPISGTAGLKVRLHTTPLYASLYRFDETLLANVHTYGSSAPRDPVLHLQHIPGGRLFDHYMESFERAWEQGQPVPPAA